MRRGKAKIISQYDSPVLSLVARLSKNVKKQQKKMPIVMNN